MCADFGDTFDLNGKFNLSFVGCLDIGSILHSVNNCDGIELAAAQPTIVTTISLKCFRKVYNMLVFHPFL